jgi:predicted GTPase
MRFISNRYGEVFDESDEDAPIPMVILNVPVEWLREYDTEIVDTPGIGSIFRDNQEITRGFIHRSDIVLFVSDCNRQFIEESEQTLLGTLKGRHIIFVLNQIDHLGNEVEDLDLILKKIVPEISTHVKDPLIIPISARKAKWALKARDENQSEVFERLWKESRLEMLERVLLSELSINDRLRYKLRSSLLNTRAAVQELSQRTHQQIDILSEKCNLLRNLVGTIGEYERVLLDNFEKVELSSIDDLMNQTQANLKKVFNEFGAVRLIYDRVSLEVRLREAFGETHLKETENKVSKASMRNAMDYLLSMHSGRRRSTVAYDLYIGLDLCTWTTT